MSCSQLYIPLSAINEFNEQYNAWKSSMTEENKALPPITLFDNVEKMVLEYVRRVRVYWAYKG